MDSDTGLFTEIDKFAGFWIILKLSIYIFFTEASFTPMNSAKLIFLKKSKLK